MAKLDPRWAMFDWQSAGRSDVGSVRSVNEDTLLDQRDHGLWMVADGMGGHAAGDVASAMISQSLGPVRHPKTLAGFVDQVEEVLITVNERLLNISKNELDNQTIGSTVVALLAHKQHCAFLWVGDSRLYRLRGGTIEMVMQEHTQAEELVEQGLIKAEDAETHPTFNVLTRAVGAQDPLIVDVDVGDVHRDDIYLLCSDGLNKAVTDEEIQQLINAEDLTGSVERLIDTAIAQGSRDNVTVMLVRAA